MIDLESCDNDDADFVSLAQQIVNGAVATLQVAEVHVVHVDNWFDHKWLGWRSRRGEEPRIPPFAPNRVCSESHLILDVNQGRWEAVALRRPLHLRQPGRTWLTQPLDRFSDSAAFIWCSGNSLTNTAGSLMFYLSGGEGYAWYASFAKGGRWKIDGARQITRRELAAFEARGRRMMLVREE
jgi:hypothetical protein